MCTTCGCEDHQHEPAGRGGRLRRVSLERSLLEKNDAFAARNRRHFQERGILALNLVSSPGSGKTSLLVAILERLAGCRPVAVVEGGGRRLEGELVLVGNGRFYGGSFPLLPAAHLQDGLLHVCVFPRVDWRGLLRCVPPFVFGQRVSEAVVRRLETDRFTITSATPVAFELDGEWVGHLPATFTVERQRLRVVVP